MKDLDKVKEYLKRVQSGDIEVDDLIDKGSDYIDNAYQARDIAEKALANKFLEQTGLPMPEKGMSSSKLEQITGDLFKQMYPDLPDPDIQVRSDLTEKGVAGLYYPDKKLVQVNKNLDDLDFVGKSLHELGHYSDHVGKNAGSIPVKQLTKAKKDAMKDIGIKSGRELLKLDSQIPSEIMQLGHHATDDGRSLALSKLTNFFKNKKFAKALPIIGPALGLGAAVTSGDVSAAVPIAQDIESLGPKSGSPESIIENPKASNEERQKAIEQIRKKQMTNLGE